MDIYTNSAAAERTVLLEFPIVDGAQVDAFAYVGDEARFEFQTLAVSPDNDGYLAVLPLFLVQFDSDIEIRWSVVYTDEADGESYTVNKVTPVQVVTPLLSRREIRQIDDVLFASTFEATKIEKAVRHIIQAYTGQEFGHYHGSLLVSGDGDTALRSPKRILELEYVNGAVATNYVIGVDGHTVYHFPFGPPPVKADYYGYHMHTGGVIHNPNGVNLAQFQRRTYKLEGRFGFESVPEPVKEAAKLLVNDYACVDSQYRDRYLSTMTAADWRIAFYSGAYTRTGNVRADQLLSDFVVSRGWGVI
jgi:hypothetical protein